MLEANTKLYPGQTVWDVMNNKPRKLEIVFITSHFYSDGSQRNEFYYATPSFKEKRPGKDSWQSSTKNESDFFLTLEDVREHLVNELMEIRDND
jgi:hypothetical protein